MKVAQSLLFCLPENKTNPMAPKNIKISATLNAKGFDCLLYTSDAADE